jgi:hypothetical protein
MGQLRQIDAGFSERSDRAPARGLEAIDWFREERPPACQEQATTGFGTNSLTP